MIKSSDLSRLSITPAHSGSENPATSATTTSPNTSSRARPTFPGLTPRSPQPKSPELSGDQRSAIDNAVMDAGQKEALANVTAMGKGAALRMGTLRLTSHAEGIAQVTIPGGPRGLRPPGTPLADIRDTLKEGATYTRLTVRGGAESGAVIGTADGQGAQPPEALAQRAPAKSAVINGGYFVHKEGLRSEDVREGSPALGRPVGATSTRGDHVPVPSPWAGVYGRLNEGEKAGVTSGPLLALNGRQPEIGDDERFQYRVGEEDNPLNRFAGALTHSSDRNERAALSVRRGSDGAPGDVIMHALTTGGNRKVGATMKEWQHITSVSAEASGTPAKPGSQPDVSTLNMDGGGSTFLGVRDENGVKKLVSGGKPTDGVRKVANVIAATPGDKGDA